MEADRCWLFTSPLFAGVVMPGQTEAHLVQLRPEMQVIFMSGYTDEAIVQQGVLTPGINFPQRPFSPMALIRKAHEVLNAAAGRFTGNV